jgi:hypothetical protein
MADSPRPDETGDDLHRWLDQAFVDHFARNAPYFGGGGPGYYGVRLEDIAPDNSALDLILTFRSGERYCCPELGCHFDLRGAAFWSGLREGMDTHGLGDLPLPTIRTVRVVVEEGVTFDPGGLRFPPLVSKGFVYEHGPFAPVIEPDEGTTPPEPIDG